MHNQVILFLSIGLGFSIVAAVALIFKVTANILQKAKTAKEEKRAALLLRKIPFDEWVHTLEKSLKQSNVKINAMTYITVSVSASFIAFITSYHHLKNFTASVFLALAFFILPEHLLHILIQRRKEKAKEQMVAAVRIFTAEYLQTPQFEKAFDAVGKRVADPVGEAFRRAYTELVLGRDTDAVLAGLAKNLNNEYGIMFVQLLKLARGDSSISSLFAELLEKIESNIELTRKNHSNLTGERILALLMTCIPIPAYFFMNSIIPETALFLSETFIGRTIITIAFGSIFVWVLLDRIMGRVES